MRVPGRSALALAALLGAAVVAAQPTRVGCGPPAAGCGPGAARVPGGSSTPTAAPSWVSATLAAWMLDEASATRVNAQGTATRNLTPDVGLGNDTTDKKEGAAAARFTGTQTLSVTESGLQGASTFTTGCWVKPNADAWYSIVRQGDGNNGLELESTGGTNFAFDIYLAAGQKTIATPLALAWTHLVGSYSARTLRVYKNGVQANTGTSTSDLGTMPGAFTLGSTFHKLNGWLDECFIVSSALSAPSICRICSCGIRGEQCTCNGAAFTSTGRNATDCGSCTLPADCSAATPP